MWRSYIPTDNQDRLLTTNNVIIVKSSKQPKAESRIGNYMHLELKDKPWNTCCRTQCNIGLCDYKNQSKGTQSQRNSPTYYIYEYGIPFNRGLPHNTIKRAKNFAFYEVIV